MQVSAVSLQINRPKFRLQQCQMPQCYKNYQKKTNFEGVWDELESTKVFPETIS